MIDLSRAGAVAQPDGEGRAGGGRCNDRVRFTLGLVGDQLEQVRFGADACAATTAAAAWLAARAEGGLLLDGARLGLAEVLAGATIEPTGAECALTAVDAFHAAIGDAVARGAVVPADPNRVIVAMSGGVDSAMVLTQTVAEGYEAVGVTLRLWIDPEAPSPERACCAPSAVRAARDLCHQNGMPHIALDLRDDFRATVVDPFVAGYAAGETPNPCTTCNGAFRFDAIDRVVRRLGALTWRTGHYVQLVDHAGTPLVARGVDATKDQSYMLALVDPEILTRVQFPLGARKKVDVQHEAAEQGLAAAKALESQEVCFLGGGALAPFLERQGVTMTPGPIVDEDGVELGTHAGALAFTPGQRRGLGVSRGTEALHVLRIDAPANTVIVGTVGRLRRREVSLRDVQVRADTPRIDACFRMRSTPVGGRLEHGLNGTGTVYLETDAHQIAPGQVAALYDGERIVAAGIVAG